MKGVDTLAYHAEIATGNRQKYVYFKLVILYLGPYKEIMVEIFLIPLYLKSNLLLYNNLCKIIGLGLLFI
jgi:hypothetical protein